MPLTRPLYRQEDLNPADITTEISDAIAAYDSPANGTYGRKDGAWVGVALAIETRSANFTAVVGGRYQTTAALTITDPATRIDGSALQDGDSYEVWIGGGNATIGGSAFAPSRHSIRRARLSGAWTTPTPTISGTLTVGSGTWSGSVFTGPQAFSSTTRPTSAGTGSPAATSLITRDDADTRYGTPHELYITTDVSAPSTTYVNSPGLTLPAGNYQFELLILTATASATGGIQTMMSSSTTTDNTTFTELRGNNISALGGNATCLAFTRAGTNILGSADVTASCFSDAPNRSATALTKGYTTIASPTTLNFRVRQRSATDAANPALIKAGSYMRFRKVP